MPIINKTKRTASIYNHGREVVKVYDHGKLAWQKSTSIPDYLCFTALESGTFTLTIPAAVTPTYLSYVEWSKDGRTWNHRDNSSEAVTIDVQVAQGEKVYWRGSGNRTTYGSYLENRSSRFSSTCRFDASGNLMSLLTDDFANVTTWSHSYTFASLFNGCTTLISAKEMRLTLTTLPSTMLIMTFNGASSMVSALTMDITDAGDNCFNSAFQGCSALTDVSGLKMTLGQLRTKVFYYTFRSCTGLVTPPPISFTSFATSSSENCLGMFYDCSSLESSFPLLPTTLVSKCYYAMFNNCRKLASVKCLATDLSATNCIYVWLANTSSTGVFIQAENVAYPRSSSGIPTGWVDIEKRTMPQGYKQVEYLSNPNYGYININRAFEANAETLEVAFVKQATGVSMPFGSSIHNYRYGSVKVTEQATALAVNVGIDFANQVNKIVSIASVTADTPRTLRYEGNASGFEVYLDGVSKSTQTCAWDAVNSFASNMVFSASANTSSTAYFHTKPIYYLKIWDGNGVLALDYVAAVRESDGVAGFYDMAANTFHKSDNANDFTAGEEI